MDTRTRDLNGNALRTRIDRDFATMIQQFENMLEEIETSEDHPPFTSGITAASKAIAANDIAQRGLRMQGMTMHMVRAAEDMLTLTRTMQELWLFGKLEAASVDGAQTVVERRAQEDASRVAALIEEVARAKAEDLSSGSEEMDKSSNTQS